MGSENYADMLSRRSFLGYVVQGAVVAVGAFGLDRLANACDESKPRKHTLAEFKSKLGKSRLEGITEEQDKELRDLWDILGDEREDIYTIYSDTKKYYNKLSKKDKREYDRFNPKDIKDTELKEFEEAIPWRLVPKNKKYSKSDKMMLFYLKSIEKALEGTLVPFM
ncbi:MAG: twin-arginine translocation signal domain-containing protein [Nanoarchaeota archaeon]|nr:twin-arginine translocation signal domain-containing protein [Nanoarchaeota archaeon]